MYCSICQQSPLVDVMAMGKWKHLEPNRLLCGHWTTLVNIIHESDLRETLVWSDATFTEEGQIKYLASSARSRISICHGE